MIGTVDAFYLPATGAMPRRLVGKEQLPRALAVQQAGGQIASLLGAPLGAVLVAAAGLTGAAFADAATFAIVLVVLVCVRPAHDVERSPVRRVSCRGSRRGADRRGGSGPAARAAADGRRRVFLLPVVSLLNPLVAREHGWSAGVAGLVAGGQSLGVIAVALVVARRGTLGRIGVGAASGLCGAALGIAAVATAGTPAVAVAGGLVVGAGSGMFACHIGPLVLTHAPGTHLARLQALLVLVQSLALVVGNNALGALADAQGARAAAAVCATGACAAGITALTLNPLRRLRRQ
ncbi:MFS transporter [Streptomyces sp. MS1.HAVA.3]|uniref:MFS transporter n=1 Tax=Streptomyces caledonius TaxID=3134107 RepID=A0ABU8U7A0_9ACTN